MIEPEMPGGPKLRLLLVEDDPSVARFVLHAATAEGWQASHAPTVSAALLRAASENFQLILLDNHLPDGEGTKAFPQLRAHCPATPIVMVTGYPDLRSAVALTRLGLFDYLPKPVELATLRACFREVAARVLTPGREAGTNQLVGESSTLQRIRELVGQAADNPAATVLLQGETGVGKDVVARAIHVKTASGDAKLPMVSLDCGAVPDTLFEAELFGTERGAYTGADRRREGLVKAAGNGTLFLDEIGEIPVALQAKLLRFLENREYRPVGSNQVHHFAGRVIAATNRDLAAEVRLGRFRADLLYRLEVITITIPPLRERREDVPPIAEALIERLSEKYARPRPLLSVADLQRLMTGDFPGNVRELRNVIERALLQTPRQAGWLQLEGLLPALPAAAPPPLPAFPSGAGAPAKLNALEAQEYALLQAALQAEAGVIARVARRLGITRQAVHRRLDKWPELRPDTVEGK